MSNKISKERKTIYYIGMGLSAIGFILFISTFFTTFTGSAFDDIGFEPGMPSSFMTAPLGMIFMIVGGFLMNLGAKGAAGSGLLLDPEKARDDLKPYSSAAGGMINDAIDNMDIVKDKKKNEETKSTQVIKIKCRACGELNEEDAKFCKSCGERM
ncbi:zinc ribbon domain-containing protein [Tissierella creatinophila]|uniref:Putative zinc-ribbon domain-containing protein n=1 Tax=Tissierella creatinophila DSM 6911 TaxID=1123403 RepID=A0A1U7M728_TISCR|nr:zinc ribbon domain-containing protein [Tissierella creatinophila]OLS03085.1 hypothetical protein TICRE_07810 [Tissierella creatinophila DSM 6911]